MEKRALLAVGLSLLVWIVWLRFFAPPPPPLGEVAGDPIPAPSLTESSTVAAVDPLSTAAPPPATAVPAGDTPGAIQPEVTAPPREITIDTPVYRVTLDNRGGVISSWVLKEYNDDHGDPLEMVSPGTVRIGRYPLSLVHADAAIEETLNTSLYAVDREMLGPGQGSGERVTFRFADGRGLTVEKRFEFGPGYLTRFTLSARQGAAPLPVSVGIGPGLGNPAENGGSSRFSIEGQAVLFDGDGLTKIPLGKVDEEEIRTERGPFVWAGLEDTYFSSILLADQGLSGAVLSNHRVVDRGVTRNYLHIAFPMDGPEATFSLFVGPKALEILTPLGEGLSRLVDYRPRFIAPIARVLLVALKFIHNGLGNFGWAIIILTIAIKLLFFPLTQRSSVSMRRMQQKMKKAQPRIQSIKDRWQKNRKNPNWRQEMNKELMGLYQKEGINPLGSVTGCLPLLLQLPVLFGLFSLLSVAIELRQAPFIFWLTDLSQQDPYYVTPIVMGLTMFLQQKMSTPVGIDPVQRRMMMMMPLMFTFFFVKFPSGLVLYWLVSNILGIGQQYLINRQADRIGVKELGARHGKLQRVSR